AGLAALGGPGGSGTVLLAPVGTSFDSFRDYRERGLTFARVARELVDVARPEAKA
ncbi:UDP-N-acetylmuramoyl-L-alanine--D-glutamate ligase, partial [Deinococcus sp. MIMF12]|nr:UDP-N-acetylmuramoyl-L-alanine--D-glutamate ligase [Deinococcus rhizophilus]